MPKVLMLRTSTGALVPLNDEEAEQLRRIKSGAVVECDIVNKRNPMFHRKFFKLLDIAFDAWSEIDHGAVYYQGQRVRPNKERFRKDITILAGFYEAVTNLKGEVRLEPKSISFSNMTQDEFEELYSAVVDVVLSRILSARGYDEERLREHVENVLRFDA